MRWSLNLLEKHLQDLGVAVNHLVGWSSIVEGSRHISCSVKILPSRVNHEQPVSGDCYCYCYCYYCYCVGAFAIGAVTIS